MSIQEYRVDVDVKQNLLITVPCKQLDNLKLIISVWDNSTQADLSNYKCRLKALKQDQIPLIQNTDITINNNVVTVETDEQLTTTSGVVKTELQFIDKTTGKKKSSFDVNFKVISSVLEVDRTISKATITLLEELDNKLDQIEDIETVLEEAKNVKDELVNKTNEANTIKNELETATTNAENKKSEINTAVTNATNKIAEVNTSISNANASKEALDTSKKNADTVKESLDESINIGNTLKTNLDEANSLATNNKTALDNSNQNATNTKNELEQLNSNATNIKNELDNSNSLATTNKSELDKANNLAQTNKTALDEANTLAEHNIEELNKLGDVTELAKQVEVNKTDIASINNKIGTTELTTTDKTITGSIEEIKGITDKNTAQLNDLANPDLSINGNFQVWQRGTSFKSLTGGKYTADRWMLICNSNNTADIEKTTTGMKIKSNVASEFISITQFVEGNFIGEILTVSASVDNKIINISGKVSKEQGYRSDDDSCFVYFKISSANSFLEYGLNVTSTEFKNVEWIKLELGSKPTQFIPRLYGEELALCQRYYREYDYGIDTGGKLAIQFSNELMRVHFDIDVNPAMRIVPTITAVKTYESGIRFLSSSGLITIPDVSIINATPKQRSNVDNLLLALNLSTQTSSASSGWIDGFKLFMDSEIY